MFLGWIGIIEPQITQAAKFLSNTKIQTDGFGMANVQVSIRFRRKPRMDALAEPLGFLICKDLRPNKINSGMVF